MGKPEQAPQPARPSQDQVSTTKAVSGPAKPGGLKHSIDVPAGWGDTVHETSWTPPEVSYFGATTAERPDGMPTEAGFVPETEVADAPAPKTPASDDAETPGPDDIKTEGETEQPLTEEEQAEPAKVAAKPEEPAPVVPESAAMLRRKALDALRLEGEKRALQDRLKAEQQAREAEKAEATQRIQEAAQRFERIKTGSLEERLKAAGFSSRDEVTEAIIRGELPDFKAPEKPPAVDDTRVARMEAELNMLRAEQQIRSVLHEQGSRATPQVILEEAARLLGRPIGVVTPEHVPAINAALSSIIGAEKSGAQATEGIKAELANAEANPAPYVRATAGALDAVTDVALSMWRGAGSKPGDFSKYAKFALESAEEMYAEKYKPILAIHGNVPAPVAAKKPATPAARPSPPVGKRVAARAAAEDDDDGPMDPVMRDAWIRDQNRKSGRTGW